MNERRRRREEEGGWTEVECSIPTYTNLSNPYYYYYILIYYIIISHHPRSFIITTTAAADVGRRWCLDLLAASEAFARLC